MPARAAEPLPYNFGRGSFHGQRNSGERSCRRGAFLQHDDSNVAPDSHPLQKHHPKLPKCTSARIDHAQHEVARGETDQAS